MKVFKTGSVRQLDFFFISRGFVPDEVEPVLDNVMMQFDQ